MVLALVHRNFDSGINFALGPGASSLALKVAVASQYITMTLEDMKSTIS